MTCPVSLGEYLLFWPGTSSSHSQAHSCREARGRQKARGSLRCGVYTFVAAAETDHTFCSLKYDKFIISQFCRLDVQVDSAGFSALDFTKPESRSYWIWALIWRLWERIFFWAYSGCWQNSFPCGCGTEVPVSLLTLAPSLGPLSLSAFLVKCYL